MADCADILIFGTGAFAQRILLDIAATASDPVRVAIAGRNRERVEWLRLAGNARAYIFQRPVTVIAQTVDLSSTTAAAEVIQSIKPSVVVQAASAQTSSVISSKCNAWSRLVAEGGLSATAVFNALLSMRVAEAIAQAKADTQLVNCCYADVVNSMIAARGLPITCGVGNVAILASVFSGELGMRVPGSLKVLAHYQTITPFRFPAAERNGPVPRVWIDGKEIEDVYSRFSSVKLTTEPVIEISGANGVPLMLAMAANRECLAHVPGPNGLPGGYPVGFRNGRLDLDLPAGISAQEAIAWNARFEQENGVVVDPAGNVHYTGVLYDRLNAASPTLAKGFHVRDLEMVFSEMEALRARLLSIT